MVPCACSDEIGISSVPVGERYFWYRNLVFMPYMGDGVSHDTDR